MTLVSLKNRGGTKEDLESFLKERTLVVSTFHTAKLDVGNAAGFIGKVLGKLTPSENRGREGEAEKFLNRWVDRWNQLGGGPFYWVMDLPYSYSLPVYAVFPIPEGVSEEKAVVVAGNLPWARQGRVVGQAVVAGQTRGVERNASAEAEVPERWRSGLKREKEADVSATVIPSDAFKRALAELLPPLPEPLGGASLGGIVNSFSRLYATAVSSPEMSFSITIETTGPSAAREALDVMVDVLSSFVEPGDDLKGMKRIRSLMTAEVVGPELRLQLSEAQALRLMEALILPPLEDARIQAQRIACVNNLKQIGLALRLYASDHDGNYPDSLKDLEKQLGSIKVLRCPADKSEPGIEFLPHIPPEERWQRISEKQLTYEYYGEGTNRDTPQEDRPNPYLTRCPVHGNWGGWDGAVYQGEMEKND